MDDMNVKIYKDRYSNYWAMIVFDTDYNYCIEYTEYTREADLQDACNDILDDPEQFFNLALLTSNNGLYNNWSNNYDENDWLDVTADYLGDV